MMSSLTNLKAIASVQNVEQKQISDSTGSTIQLGGNKITDTDLKKLSNDKISKDNTKDNFNKLLNQVKNKINKNVISKNTLEKKILNQIMQSKEFSKHKLYPKWYVRWYRW